MKEVLDKISKDINNEIERVVMSVFEKPVDFDEEFKKYFDSKFREMYSIKIFKYIKSHPTMTFFINFQNNEQIYIVRINIKSNSDFFQTDMFDTLNLEKLYPTTEELENNCSIVKTIKNMYIELQKYELAAKWRDNEKILLEKLNTI